MEFTLPMLWLAGSFISFIIAMFYNTGCNCSCGCECHIPTASRGLDIDLEEERAVKKKYEYTPAPSKRWINFGWLGMALQICYFVFG